MKSLAGYRSTDVSKSRIDDFFEVDQWAMVGEWLPEDRQDYVDAVALNRCRAVEVQDASRGVVGEFAGVHSSFGTEMTVPGGRVPTAGLSWVGVHPAHRRRGILRAMMRDHFARCRGRGEHVSALYATQAAIYTRFGYGLGSQTIRAKIPHGAKLRKVAGSEDLTVRLERADFATHDAIVQGIQDRITRPGTVLTPKGSGRYARFTDPVGNRNGFEKWRLLLVEDAGDPVAYAFFRRKARKSDGLAVGTAQLAEQGALTPAAAHRMWTVLSNFDLVQTTTTANLATDDALIRLLADARVIRPMVMDNLWVRVLDVSAALEAREYYRDLDLTLLIRDKNVVENAGAWRVLLNGGRAKVCPADASATPDLALDIEELSSAYLGGVSVESMAAAGLIEERTPGTVHDLAVAMFSPVAPHANWDF